MLLGRMARVAQGPWPPSAKPAAWVPRRRKLSAGRVTQLKSGSIRQKTSKRFPSTSMRRLEVLLAERHQHAAAGFAKFGIASSPRNGEKIKRRGGVADAGPQCKARST